MNAVIVLPARLKSTRLPNKMLASVGGVPLIVASAKNAAKTGLPVLVAADDESIREVCLAHNVLCEMTPVQCQSGTDRMAFLAHHLNWHGVSVINVQGDEPLLEPELILAVAQKLEAGGAEMTTAAVALDGVEQWRDPNCVKVVANDSGKVLYFSRAPVPFDRDAQHQRVPSGAYRHLGIYGYRSEVLHRWPQLPESMLEQVEKLEQWRALEAGVSMSLHIAERTGSISVDTAADLARVQALLG